MVSLFCVGGYLGRQPKSNQRLCLTECLPYGWAEIGDTKSPSTTEPTGHGDDGIGMLPEHSSNLPQRIFSMLGIEAKGLFIMGCSALGNFGDRKINETEAKSATVFSNLCTVSSKTQRYDHAQKF